MVQVAALRLPTEARQAEIVAAALALSALRSPADITTADISDELGLSQGALFKHFATKEAIWLAVMEWVSATLPARLEQAQAQLTSPTEALRAVFLAHVRFVMQHPGVPSIVFHELQQATDSPLKQRVRSVQQRYRQLLERLLARAVEAGESASSLDQAAAATLFLGMVQGLVMQSMLADQPQSLLEQAERVFAVYRRAIRA